MYKIIADTHTHTMACDHAFSTIKENIGAAKKNGMKFLAVTEHTKGLYGSPSDMYFRSLRRLPRIINDVIILKGAEVNILDYNGTLDVDEQLLEKLEWTIASYHPPVIDPASEADHTNGWIKIAENPYIHVIGHCGNPRYSFDIDKVLKKFKEYGKIVEINSGSAGSRAGSTEKCIEIVKKCKELKIPVVVSSDAHIEYEVGVFDESIKILRAADFPEEYVLNADYNRFLETVENLLGHKIL